jgi:hypothetical protein
MHTLFVVQMEALNIKLDMVGEQDLCMSDN